MKRAPIRRSPPKSPKLRCKSKKDRSSSLCDTNSSSESDTDELTESLPQLTARNKRSESDKNFLFLTERFFLILAMVIVVISCASFYFLASSSKGDTANLSLAVEKFTSDLKNIENRYTNQSRRSWTIIKAAVKSSLFVRNPKRPGVLLFASVDGAARTANCIIHKLTKTISSNNVPFRINSEQFSYRDADETKKALDDKLQKAFTGDNQVVVIEKIDSLPPTSSLLLYGYCDTETAPRKDYVYILTVDIPSSYSSGKIADNDGLVEDYLSERWRELGKDQLGALMSRIANSIVFVKPDENC